MLVDVVGNFFKKVKCFIRRINNYIKNVKSKLKNLEETNLNIAISYLDANKLQDAYTRFKIIHKLWPDNVDGIYFYALLLFFSEKKEKAIEILNKNRNDKDTKKLLEIIKEKDMDYVIDIVNENMIKLSGIRDVL